LWSDIRKIIVPTLVDKVRQLFLTSIKISADVSCSQVGYIPIPRIECTDDAIGLVVEKLTMPVRNLFPNIVTLEAHHYVKFSLYSAITNEHHHEFTLKFGQMQADM
jgi:hypothetical protein